MTPILIVDTDTDRFVDMDNSPLLSFTCYCVDINYVVEERKEKNERVKHLIHIYLFEQHEH